MLLHKWRNKKGTQENHHVTVCYIDADGRNKKQVFSNAPSDFSQNHACQACNRKEVLSKNSVKSLTRYKYMNKLSFYACNPCCDMCEKNKSQKNLLPHQVTTKKNHSSPRNNLFLTTRLPKKIGKHLVYF